MSSSTKLTELPSKAVQFTDSLSSFEYKEGTSGDVEEEKLVEKPKISRRKTSVETKQNSTSQNDQVSDKEQEDVSQIKLPLKRSKSAPTKGSKKQVKAKSKTDVSAADKPAQLTSTKSELKNVLPEEFNIEPINVGEIKLVSYNVAGINSAIKKGLERYVLAEDADIIFFQETKLNAEPEPGFLSEIEKVYPYRYWSNCKTKKGYSGTALLSKIKPLNVTYGIDGDDSEFNSEGRCIVCEFENFYLVTSYVPNASTGLSRLPQKRHYMSKMHTYLQSLDSIKPVIWSGDLNVAVAELDLKNPKTNTKSAGFTPEEREDMSKILDSTNDQRFIDAWRQLNPDEPGYTYWGFRFNCKSKDIGWRLDYYVVSERIMERVRTIIRQTDVYGASDHCPLVLIMKQ